MAKKRTAKPKEFSASEIALAGKVAKDLGVHPNTLSSAMKAGFVETTELACGSRVVVVASAKSWAQSERKRGPKPKKS